MKYITTFLTLTVLIITLNNCKTSEQSTKLTVYNDTTKLESEFNLEFTMLNGESFNHPTYVLWIEDMEGNYVKTLYITKSYASGVFNYSMENESKWKDESGESIQPGALPYWTFKKGLIENKQLVPTADYPFVDAYTGATATDDFQFNTNLEGMSKTYRVLFEVNQPWDWNKFWTNDKYPKSEAYKHSAQPSIIYGAIINNTSEEFYLNPIGHGDPKGETEKLFTDLSTITTAKDIFKTIKVQVKN